ncbi:MAG TPA: restriction endonuclease [Deltaproteobacteria bacterium]|nr:restriction endonuclease [Deltaproteobacteria bacterium]
MVDIEERLREAIRHYWTTRSRQRRMQGSRSGRRDYGNRGAVTGGAQIDGFISLMRDLLVESGLPEAAVHCRRTVLPGYYRPSKEWDLVVVHNGSLIATIEFKSQAGPSYGNNFNNRVEEAVGSAADLWKAYEKGGLRPSAPPWLGYFMLLEEESRSTSAVGVREPHFKVLREFYNASYADRYRIFCERLVRERLYDAACFMMSDREKGLSGEYREPSEELSFERFATSIMGKAMAYARRLGRRP